MQNKKTKKSSINITEEQFLSCYSVEDYERPSVTTDIAVFSMFSKKVDCHRKDAEQELSVLLVKRGEHPYINKWALPGGFLRSDETIEECALRELKEETNISPVSIIPVGVFSNPDRDPRGRIISNSFASVISEANVKVAGGADATDAKWFSVDFKICPDGKCYLSLENGEEKIFYELKQTNSNYANTRFQVISGGDLAFDHAKIIVAALAELRKKAKNPEVAFDFLPKRFTLASLQRVQETLLGTSLLTANFRRKISGLVEETDEYTEGIGHRPARLFKKKGDGVESN